jgi:6-phosphofructokinase 2
VKPSVGELRKLTGLALEDDAAIAEAAQAIVARGQAQLVAVTMGRDGALLADASGAVRLPPIPVKASSAVGAGDSFLAGMVYALADGWGPAEALRFGQAAGAAAVLTPGTDLALAEDIRRLYVQAAEVEAPSGAPVTD